MNVGTIRSTRSLLIFTLDLIAIISIFSGVYYLRLSKLPNYYSSDLWLITLTFISVLFISGTYFKERGTKLPALPIRTFLISIVAGTICIVWLYLLGPSSFTEYFGRGILPTATILCGISATWIRFAINGLYHRQELGAELLYLGYSASGSAFLNELKDHSEVRLITIATQSDVKVNFDRYSLNRSEVSELLLDFNWQSVVIDPSYNVSKKETDNLVSLRLKGTPVLSLTEFYEKFWFMIPVHDISDDWFLQSQGFSMLGSPISMRVKRLIDLILSSVLLAISAPLVLFFGLLIKLTSKGPMFFAQTRVGLKSELFTIYKLRTMVIDAEASGAQWAAKNDSRITHLGRFLRQARIDELPQCWNVLKGNMSFVGPRPERPEFTKELSEKIPYYDLRHLVKPGISGWAQVIFPYGASAEDSLRKLQYELYYIKNQSLLLDLNIMLRTLITIFQRSGR
jgi:exopolysaccharide biosynthesis polyprenyl glycosylphosphotransferase